MFFLIFDNVDVEQDFIEIDGIGYPRDSIDNEKAM